MIQKIRAFSDLRMILYPILSLLFIILYYLNVLPSYSISSIGLYFGIFIGFIGVIISIFYLKGYGKKLFSVIVFMLCIHILPVLRAQPWGFSVESDSVFEMQTVILMIQSGRWSPGVGTSRTWWYSFYPGMYTFITSLAEISSFPLYPLLWLIPSITAVVSLLFFYLAIEKLCSKETAIWASLIYAISPGFQTFDSYFHREVFALSFFFLCLYMLVRLSNYRLIRLDRRNLVVMLIATLMVVITHHWTSYNLLIFLTLFYIFPYFYRKPLNLVPGLYFLSVGVLVFMWAFFVTFIGFLSQLGWGVNSFLKLIAGPTFGKPVGQSGELLGYSSFEVVVIYAGQILLVLLVFLGLVERSTEKGFISAFVSSFIKYLAVFSLLYTGFFTFIVPRLVWWDLSLSSSLLRRNWEFGYVGLAILAGKAVSKSNNFNIRGITVNSKKTKAFLLLLPLLSCVLLYNVYVRDLSYPVLGVDSYRSTQWLKLHSNETRIASDFDTRPLFEGYSYTQDVIWNRTEFVNNLYYYGRLSPRIYYTDTRVIVWNKQLAQQLMLADNPEAASKAHWLNRIYDTKSVALFYRSL